MYICMYGQVRHMHIRPGEACTYACTATSVPAARKGSSHVYTSALNMYMYIHIYICIYIHTYIYIYIYVCMQVHVHMHMAHQRAKGAAGRVEWQGAPLGTVAVGVRVPLHLRVRHRSIRSSLVLGLCRWARRGAHRGSPAM